MESSNRRWAGTAAKTSVQAEWEPEVWGRDNPTPPGTRLHREDIHKTTHQYTLNVGKG